MLLLDETERTETFKSTRRCCCVRISLRLDEIYNFRAIKILKYRGRTMKAEFYHIFAKVFRSRNFAEGPALYIPGIFACHPRRFCAPVCSVSSQNQASIQAVTLSMIFDGFPADVHLKVIQSLRNLSGCFLLPVSESPCGLGLHGLRISILTHRS